MIELKGICKSFKNGDEKLDVLKDLDLVINDGEILAITGPSGAGKSTLLNIIGMIEPYDKGLYVFNACDAADYSEKEKARIRNREFGFIVQDYALVDYYSVEDNIAIPMVYAGIGKTERIRRTIETLELLGIADKMKCLPGTLSGGQKQRAAIARAIINDASVILADEPTGSLDMDTGLAVMRCLRKINEVRGTAIVIVTHNPEIADMCDRRYELKNSSDHM